MQLNITIHDCYKLSIYRVSINKLHTFNHFGIWERIRYGVEDVGDVW